MSTWKLGEKEVYDYYSTHKNSYIYRFSDTHDVNAQLKHFGDRMVYAAKTPADFLVVHKSRTFFLEVKTTSNVKGITSSLFKQQAGLRDRILKCSGEYYYHIYSIVNKQWYFVPGWVISESANRTWEELKLYKVSYLKDIKE